MKDLLGTKEESKMLQKFLAKACSPASPDKAPSGPIQNGLSHTGRERLKADLEMLIQTNGLPKGLSPNTKVLVVNGQEDEIVCNSTRTLFITDLINHLHKNPLHWHLKGEGHFIHLNNLIEKVFYWLES